MRTPHHSFTRPEGPSDDFTDSFTDDPRRPGDHPRGGRGRRGGFGPEGLGPGGFGPGGFGPGGRGPGHRGSRRGRGQMRAAVLLLLDEGPRHGYQIITDITERSDGTWQPSPGAVYPAIAQLQDEGLVSVADDGGRRLASLTDAGRTYLESHRDELGTPWEQTDDPRRGGHRELRTALHALHGAVEQVGRTGTPEQTAKAVEILTTARREVYLLLAE
ncbi:PadR family transcriptional regulator [Isoptericola jiangsuensis]|uniref:PadR family transcriptional regulator n=1 Tax=Isoptericola jiangsuensis TaxID=548579 RepID=UPI003AB0B67F